MTPTKPEKATCKPQDMTAANQCPLSHCDWFRDRIRVTEL